MPKKRLIKSLSAFAIAAIVGITVFCTRDYTTGSNGSTSLATNVLWKKGATVVRPDEVDSVRITISSSEFESSIKGTYAFTAKAAIIDVPTGSSVSVLVEGLDSLGNVVYSGTVGPVTVSGTSFKIDIDAQQMTPIAPDSLAGQALSYKTVKLTWIDKSSNETRFVIERRSGSSPFDSIGAVIGDGENFVDTGLSASTAYYYRISALNLAGRSINSDTITVTTPAIGANSTPYFTSTAADLRDTVNVGALYTSILKASDDDGDALAFSVSSPLTLIGADTATWMPNQTQVGTRSVWATACDDSEACDTVGWQIVVEDTGDAGAAVDSGLAVYFPFDGNANDGSKNGNNGTVSGATLTTDRFGNANSAYSFDGTDDYLTADISSSIKTLSFWYKAGSVEADDRILSICDVDVVDSRFAILHEKQQPPRIRLELYDGSSKYDFYTGAFKQDDTSWHHQVVVANGTQIKWYIDGTAEGIASHSGNLVPATFDRLTLGAAGMDWGAGWTTKYYMDVDIDDVRLYSNALDSTQIDSLYRIGGWPLKQMANLDSGLVAYYPFNGSGNDMTGNGNRGAVYGATLTSDRFGQAESAYNFDGINDLVQVSHSASLESSDGITISIWAKVADFGTPKASDLIRKKGGNDQPGYVLRCQSDTLQLVLSNGSNSAIAAKDSIRCTEYLNSWHFFAATYSANTRMASLYVDGQLRRQINDTWSLQHSDDLYIMGQPYSSHSDIKGAADDIRIYNRALYSAEIDSLYRLGGWTGSAPGFTPSGMVIIPAKDSTFQMGQPDPSPDCDSCIYNEQPVHAVTLTYNFWMDTTEVTQKQYADLMSVTYSGYSTPSWTTDFGLGDKMPVYHINWYDAVLFCNARSKQDGMDTIYAYASISGTPGDSSLLSGVVSSLSKNGYRLPTEAEWEYACRAGTTTDFYWGKNFIPYPQTASDSAEIGNYAVWGRNSAALGKGHPDYGAHHVASKLPNAYGLYDIIGNVWEWCNDWAGPYSGGAITDPTGPNSGTYRRVRGGCWYINGGRPLRSTFRDGDNRPEDAGDIIGIRLVLPIR